MSRFVACNNHSQHHKRVPLRDGLFRLARLGGRGSRDVPDGFDAGAWRSAVDARYSLVKLAVDEARVRVAVH